MHVLGGRSADQEEEVLVGSVNPAARAMGVDSGGFDEQIKEARVDAS
jgi:hypothetical protein